MNFLLVICKIVIDRVTSGDIFESCDARYKAHLKVRSFVYVMRVKEILVFFVHPPLQKFAVVEGRNQTSFGMRI